VKKEAVEVFDDFDGFPASETIRFSVDSQDYEIDLTEEHALEFRAAAKEFIQYARLAGIVRQGKRSRRGPLERVRSQKVRVWAVRKGLLEEGSRGRIPGVVVDQYDKAHKGH
jgi:hypothetical protein